MRTILTSLALLVILSLTAFCQDRFTIDFNANTSLLPYKCDSIVGENFFNRKRIYKSAMPYKIARDASDTAVFLTFRNRLIERDESATVSFRQLVRSDRTYFAKFVRDQSFNMVVKDWHPIDSSQTGYNRVACSGFYNDSIYIGRLDSIRGSKKTLFLMAGQDNSGDSIYEPHVFFCLIEDYDFDGQVEAFVTVNCHDDGTVDDSYHLFCVNIDSMTVEWHAPMATFASPSASYCNGIYSCGSSADPEVIMITFGNMKGYQDDNFNDSFKYICKYNSRGELIFNRIIAAEISNPALIPAWQDDRFLVSHPLEFTDPYPLGDLNRPGLRDSLKSSKYYISEIDTGVNLIKRIELSQEINYMWHSFFKSQDSCLFVHYLSGKLDVFDRDFNLIASSVLGNSIRYIDIIDFRDKGRCYVYSDGIYDSTFAKLVHFPFRVKGFNKLQTVAGDNLYLIDGIQRYQIIRITKNSLINLLTTFVIQNRAYFFTALPALLIILLVTNYYRHKNRRNLIKVARQKKELEKAHEKLRKAQETIIAQEKYRQAKDIAGGFAHEIRNALTPSKNVIYKLSRANENQLRDSKWIGRITDILNRATDRAIQLTKTISQYTSLETIPPPKPVNIAKVIEDVLDYNRKKIEQSGINVKLEAEPQLLIESNYEQMFIVLNNLVTNSLEALTGTENPSILVETRHRGGKTEIEIRDNGSGIEPDKLDRIFEIFYSTKPDTGTGLGLAIVRKIVESYNGKIIVNSSPGDGTAFLIMFE